MAPSRRVDLYCEDDGHERFAQSLIERIADELHIDVQVDTKSGRGGHGRAIREFKAWQRAAVRNGLTGIPDLLVVVIDTNCSSWNQAHGEVLGAVDPGVFPAAVAGCPDPHVERWCFADPAAFHRVVGQQPPVDPGKCERGLYKRLLRDSILAAGQPILVNEMEFALEIVDAMDLYTAGKAQESLGHFIDGLQSVLRRWNP